MMRALLLVCASECLVVPPARVGVAPALSGSTWGTTASVGVQSVAADHHDRSDVDLGAGWSVRRAGDTASVHSSYVSLATRLSRLDRRVWLGGVTSVFWSMERGQPRESLAVRLALRQWLGGVSAGSRTGSGAAAVHGSFALSLHADVGAQRLDGGGDALLVAVGASIDLPALFAANRPSVIWW